MLRSLQERETIKTLLIVLILTVGGVLCTTSFDWTKNICTNPIQHLIGIAFLTILPFGICLIWLVTSRFSVESGILNLSTIFVGIPCAFLYSSDTSYFNADDCIRLLIIEIFALSIINLVAPKEANKQS